MNADGTVQTLLTNNVAMNTWPAWSPDGTKIIFNSNREGNNEIYIMNPDGTVQTHLTSITAYDGLPNWGVTALGKSKIGVRNSQKWVSGFKQEWCVG